MFAESEKIQFCEHFFFVEKRKQQNKVEYDFYTNNFQFLLK